MKTYVVLISNNSDGYGAERSLVSLAKFINSSEKLSSFVVIPRSGRIISLLEDANVDFIVQSFQGNVNYGRGLQILRGVAKYLINLISSIKLSRNLKTRGMNIGLVHTNTITTDFGIQLSQNLDIPHIWHIRELAKMAFNFDFELGTCYLNSMATKSNVLICNSNAVKEYYEQIIRHKKFVTVYNGVSKRMTCEAPKQNKTFRIIYIARLTPEKSHDAAIQACMGLLQTSRTDFSLDLWGDGCMQTSLEENVAELGLDRHIFFRGFSDSIPLDQYHVGLTCCEHEAFGRATVEYMLSGIPVVGVDGGANKELINENNGFLYAQGDIAAFTKILSRLYDNRELGIEKGEFGRKYAIDNFSEENYCESIMDIYNDLL